MLKGFSESGVDTRKVRLHSHLSALDVEYTLLGITLPIPIGERAESFGNFIACCSLAQTVVQPKT